MRQEIKNTTSAIAKYFKEKRGIIVYKDDKEEIAKFLQELYSKAHIEGYIECEEEDWSIPEI